MSFGQENIDGIIEKYEELLEKPAQLKIRNAHFVGFAFGYSGAIKFFYIGFVFWIGAIIADRNPEVGFDRIFKAIYVIFICGLTAG